MIAKIQEKEKFTKYEVARILGARALQISMDAPLLLKIEKEELEKINFDSLKISEMEFYASVLPITVKRPLPKRLEAKLKREAEEAKKEEDAENIEKKEEAEIKEKGEIMELVKPEDEIEEEVQEEAEGEAI